MTSLRKSKVGFVKKALQGPLLPEVHLVAAVTIENEAISEPSISTNCDDEVARSAILSNSPTTTSSNSNSVERRPDRPTGYNTKFGFQEDTHATFNCNYCRRGGHILRTCLKWHALHGKEDRPQSNAASTVPSNREEKSVNRHESEYSRRPDRPPISYESFSPIKRTENSRIDRNLRRNRDSDRYNFSSMRSTLPRDGHQRQAPSPPHDRRRNDKFMMNQNDIYADALRDVEITQLDRGYSRPINRTFHSSRNQNRFTNEDISDYYQRRNNSNPNQICGTRSDQNFDERFVVRRHFLGESYVAERRPHRVDDDFDL